MEMESLRWELKQKAVANESDEVAAEARQVFPMSPKAGGVALNLTVASHVFLMDPWRNPAVEQQAQDHIHCLGQYKPMNVGGAMHQMLWGWKAELQAVPASSLLAETSSLESIDTWSGIAVKMMRMMML
ncbi:unnamed protein product [Sphagnum troendelagicum]|uniref:Uncharacterized protein n=1 Tax=Sphagnum troendelagicum TaxID=128251 RepID=A0ABP0UHY3_9BRYO